MRKSLDDRPARIWSFALPHGPEPECAAIVERQYQLAADYYRALMEIEIERLRRYRDARAARFPALGAAEDALRAAEREYAAAKDADEDDEVIDSSKARMREAAAHVKETRRAIPKDDLDDFSTGASYRRARAQRFPALAAAEAKLARVVGQDKESQRKGSGAKRAAIESVEEILATLPVAELLSDEWASLAIKRARAAHGPSGMELCTGTYMRVEDRVQQSIRQRRKLGLDPEWSPWRGEGVIGVQIQGGREQSAVLGGDDTKIRITRREGYAKARFRKLHLRGPGDTWLRFNLIMHRELPPGALIAGAYVSRELTTRLCDGRPRYKYTLCLVLKDESFRARVEPKAALACGINFGYCHDTTRGNDAYRVAYVVGSDGRREAVELPEDIMRDFVRAERVQEARSRHLNDFQKWAREHVPALLPHGFDQWRSVQRVEDFARHLATAGRCPEHVERLRAFARQSRHLGEYEAGLRSQTVARRNEFYRLAARSLAGRYTYLFSDDQSMDELKRRTVVEHGKGVARDLAARQFQLVSPGSFRAALQLMAPNVGSLHHAVDAIDISTICHVCGAVAEAAKPGKRLVVCRDMHRADVDQRAASNVLARGLATLQSPEPLADNDSRTESLRGVIAGTSRSDDASAPSGA